MALTAADMDAAAKEIFEAIAPLLPNTPEYMVWVEPNTDCVMVGTVKHTFAVTRLEVEDGLHIARAKASLPDLIAAVTADSPVLNSIKA